MKRSGILVGVCILVGVACWAIDEFYEYRRVVGRDVSGGYVVELGVASSGWMPVIRRLYGRHDVTLRVLDGSLEMLKMRLMDVDIREDAVVVCTNATIEDRRVRVEECVGGRSVDITLSITADGICSCEMVRQ